MPPFAGPAGHVVHDRGSPRRRGRPVVHLDGNRDLDRLLALAEDADQVGVDAERLADAAELRTGELEGILAKVSRCLGGAHLLLRASRTTS